MHTWSTIHRESRDGFDISLDITPEFADPRQHFDESLLDDVLEGIDNGSYEWFIARAKASRHGVDLGESYIGGCLYADVREFVADEYWHLIANQAVAEAKSKLALLRAEP